MTRVEIPIRTGLRFADRSLDFAPPAGDLGKAETVAIEFEGRTFVWHEIPPNPASPPFPETRWGPTVTALYRDPERDAVTSSLSRFLSALAFKFDLPIETISPTLISGSSEPDPLRPPLHRQQDHFGFGHMIETAPATVTLTSRTDIRLALAIYREAVSATSPYLAFNAWWGVLDAVLRTRDAVDEYINAAAAASEGEGLYSYAAAAVKRDHVGDDVAEYLRHHGRNAIAHVVRYRAEDPHVDPDDPATRARLAAEGYWLRWIARDAILASEPEPVALTWR